MFSSFTAITKNSFIEIIRQPIYDILLAVGIFLIAFSPAVTMFSMTEEEFLMVDMGLATILLLGMVMAVLGATQVLSREIEGQTVGAILSKPVGRFTFVLAKFSGVSLAMGLSTYLLILVLLMTLRIGVPATAKFEMDYPALLGVVVPFVLAVLVGTYCNYFYRWSFSSTAIMAALPLYTIAFAALLVVNPVWKFEFLPAIFVERRCWQVARAALLIFMGVWVLCSVAVAASTRLNVVMNAIVCLAVFFVGMITQFLFGQFASHSLPAWVALRIVPSLHVFWVGDQLMTEVPYVPMKYVGMAALYAVGYCAAMVAFASFLFERREVI